MNLDLLIECIEVLEAAPANHYGETCYIKKVLGVTIVGECHPDCWELKRQKLLRRLNMLRFAEEMVRLLSADARHE